MDLDSEINSLRQKVKDLEKWCNDHMVAHHGGGTDTAVPAEPQQPQEQQPPQEQT